MTPYRIIGPVAISRHGERLRKILVVDADGKPAHYADSREDDHRWIGSKAGVETRQQKAKKGKGEAA